MAITRLGLSGVPIGTPLGPNLVIITSNQIEQNDALASSINSAAERTNLSRLGLTGVPLGVSLGINEIPLSLPEITVSQIESETTAANIITPGISVNQLENGDLTTIVLPIFIEEVTYPQLI